MVHIENHISGSEKCSELQTKSRKRRKDRAHLKALSLVPVVGLEPTRGISPTDFESVTSTIPSHRPVYSPRKRRFVICPHSIPHPIAFCQYTPAKPSVFLKLYVHLPKKPVPSCCLPDISGSFSTVKTLPNRNGVKGKRTPSVVYFKELLRGSSLPYPGRYGKIKAVREHSENSQWYRYQPQKDVQIQLARNLRTTI